MLAAYTKDWERLSQQFKNAGHPSMVSMPIINAESLCNEYCFIGGSGVQLSMDTPDFGSDINSDSFPGRFVCGEIDDVERVSRVICDNIAYCCKEELCFQVYLVSIAVLKCCYSD